MSTLTLTGRHVRLEPLERRHIPDLLAASTADPSPYGWSFVPQTLDSMTAYVETALQWQRAGTAIPFATVDAATNTVIGSTRFFDLERWIWPEGHPRHETGTYDVCEIGYTWLTGRAIRTAANTECKLLMLTHAFERWQVLRVCLQTDARNERSRAAIERLGARFEGLLRAHRLATDYTARDSARYSILASEWPQVKERLKTLAT